MAELYVASTRGNYGLYLFAGKELASALDEAIQMNSPEVLSQKGAKNAGT